jgi:hypothetical protein
MQIVVLAVPGGLCMHHVKNDIDMIYDLDIDVYFAENEELPRFTNCGLGSIRRPMYASCQNISI